MVNEKKCRYMQIALDVIKPQKEVKSSIWQIAVSAVISVFIALLLSSQQETLAMFREVNSMFLNIYIAFIAMEMGAYTLFQALLKNELVYRLYVTDNLLEESNKSFLGVILLFWLGIMVSIIISVFMQIIPDSWTLFKNINYNVLVSTALLSVYLLFYIRVLFEIRNFAINLYKVFQAHNKVSLLEYFKSQEQQKEGESKN